MKSYFTHGLTLIRDNVYVWDVARFKRSVRIGEYLFYDETTDGIRIDCKVLKKYPWFAVTDVGCIDWNWLCVMNKERIPRQ